MRKIKAFRAGEIDIMVEFDPIYEEYIVKLFNNGVEYSSARYYTDDREDAIAVLAMFKSFLSADL